MKKIHTNKKGFSLVEFIVILTIFAIMTSVSLFNYNQHQSTLEQSNLAQDIALTIRQAQVYGISATNKVYGAADTTFDAEEYLDISESGINVIKDASIRGISLNLGKGSITLYSDVDTNNFFNNSDDTLIDERSIISNKLGFDKIILFGKDGSENIKTSGVLDISFKRPYPDAIVGYRSNSESRNGSLQYSKVSIILKDMLEENNKTAITINSIGNISIEKYDDE